MQCLQKIAAGQLEIERCPMELASSSLVVAGFA